MSMAFSEFEIDALKFIECGANVYGSDTARVIRHLAQRMPGAITIGPARDEPRQVNPAHFYAELTAAGRERISV
jgi:hypothetical protein